MFSLFSREADVWRCTVTEDLCPFPSFQHFLSLPPIGGCNEHWGSLQLSTGTVECWTWLLSSFDQCPPIFLLERKGLHQYFCHFQVPWIGGLIQACWTNVWSLLHTQNGYVLCESVCIAWCCVRGGGGIFAVLAYLCASDLTYMMRTHRILCLGPFVCL